MTRRFRVDLDAEGHDDELADFGGAADVALIAVTVAMHVATIALLHRSARQMTDRSAAMRAAELVLARLRRRGAFAVAEALAAHLTRLGTASFDRPLRAAADAAARRVREVPRTQLAARVGRAGAIELLEMRTRACLPYGRLLQVEVAFVADHLAAGGELDVGLGQGRVFVRGGDARPMLRTWAGRTELHVIAPTPVPRDEEGDRAREEWAAVHREVQRDPILAEIVSELFGKAGFETSAVVLRRLLELAPLIRRHEAVARGVLARVPPRIEDTMRQVVEALALALRDADQKPKR